MGGRGSSSSGKKGGGGGGGGGGVSEMTTAIGGKAWTGGGNDRIYINDPVQAMRAVGYKVDTYGTGAIKSATSPSGEKISNNQAYKLSQSLNKSYYDVKTKKFSANNAVTQALSAKFKV
jgi:hypothetical protein